MAFDGILVKEIFHSLQGETSLSGLRFAFIRLTGCNLRCTYCDSAHAFHGGEKLSVSAILERIEGFSVKHVLITGGEPLLQRNTPELIQALRTAGYEVSIETHGEISIAAATSIARIVMDIKTPGSGMCRGNFVQNLPLLKATDEIKFVITSKADYRWAKTQISDHSLTERCEILFSCVVPLPGTASEDPSFSLEWLADQIVQDRLDVRLQTQLHKLIWGPERIGV